MGEEEKHATSNAGTATIVEADLVREEILRDFRELANDIEKHDKLMEENRTKTTGPLDWLFGVRTSTS